jgi:DNA-binding MarR family transcriptional regulator
MLCILKALKAPLQGNRVGDPHRKALPMDARPHGLPGPALIAETTLDYAGLDALLGYRLRRAQGAAHRDYLLALENLRLTQKQTAVMWLVEANPGIAQGTIGASLGMDRATMMVLVDRLEARGLLRRIRSRSDGRRRELHVTPTGTRLLGRVRERIAAHEQRMKELFSTAELQTLERLLDRLQRLDPAT